MFLFNVILVKIGDLQSALGSFEKALDMAQVQGDKAAETAIKRAVEDVNNKIVKGIKGEDGDEEEEQEEEPAADDSKAKSPEPTKEKSRSPSPVRSPTPEKAKSPSPVPSESPAASVKEEKGMEKTIYKLVVCSDECCTSDFCMADIHLFFSCSD